MPAVDVAMHSFNPVALQKVNLDKNRLVFLPQSIEEGQIQDAYHRSSIAIRPFDAGDGMGDFYTPV